MPKFVDVTFKVTTPPGEDAFNVNEEAIRRRLFENAVPMARRMGEAYQNNLKIALVRRRAIATGDTLRSVRDEMVLESPSRQLIRRRVIASRSIIFVQGGRKPGKAPIRFVGKGPRGGKKFEPLPQLVRWFVALNIRRALWMPIARAIGRRGIKPREVQMRAVNQSRPAWQAAIQKFGVDFAQSIFRK